MNWCFTKHMDTVSKIACLHFLGLEDCDYFWFNVWTFLMLNHDSQGNKFSASQGPQQELLRNLLGYWQRFITMLLQYQLRAENISSHALVFKSLFWKLWKYEFMYCFRIGTSEGWKNLTPHSQWQSRILVPWYKNFQQASPSFLYGTFPKAIYYLTCKLSHVWFKVKFSEIYICGNFVIIQTFLSLEPPQVVVDAAVIQLKRSIMSQQMGTTKDLSINFVWPF